MKKKMLLPVLVLLCVSLVGCSTSNYVNYASSKTNISENNDSNSKKEATSDSTISTSNSNSNQQATSNMNHSNSKQQINNEKTYSIAEKQYNYNQNNKTMALKYPQINGMSNASNQNKINTLIKEQALKYVQVYLDNKENFNINLGYEICLNKYDLLSIKYSGIFSSKDVAYPTNLLFSTNVDLKNNKVLNSGDIVNLDNNFLITLKSKGIIANNSNKDLYNAQKDQLQSYSTNNFNNSIIYIYLYENSISISIDAPHAIGDYIDLKLQYQDINKSINNTNSTLSNFYKHVIS
ncbi:hypothetical protein [Clostridium sp. C8-1-8]|uniref:hypothetical protein n=1 Tax=Clostridium sp. C8-1-8 TaxID=2698831 RepID=UPI001368D9A5|nr:hypothetical protein [Clostridium sp. C8-1-8]